MFTQRQEDWELRIEDVMKDNRVRENSGRRHG
jgi:hypothetical protein